MCVSCLLAGREDAEDGDPTECNSDADTVVDDQGCDDIDDDREPEEGVLFHSYGIDQTKGVVPHVPRSADKLVREHRDRIRRDRCTKVTYGGTVGGHAVTEYLFRNRG